jgi:monoamine oxidase
MPDAVDVIVVGGGIAGLVAASIMHQHGAKTVCLEARERVGGRVSSAAGWLDLGATWFWDGQVAIAETVASAGLRTYPQALDGDALIEPPTGEAVRLAGNPIDRPARRVEGGMQALALELARRLPAGMLRTATPVRAIALEADGSVRVATDTETLAASVVVLAVPPALAVESIGFAPALPPGIADAARAVHTWMSDTVKVVARFPEPFWRAAGLAGAALSHAGPFCEFHDHSGPAHQAALFGFAPAARLGGAAADEIRARFVEQTARLFGPAARQPDDVLVADWSSDPFTAATTRARPSSHWYYGTPVLRLSHLDGRLVFGSTETASAFPGYLEGTVLAGRRAAGQALDRLGDP